MQLTTEQRVSLTKLAMLMRAARSDSSKGDAVFQWIWSDGEDLLLDVMGEKKLCNDVFYLVDDILTDLKQHALDWVVGKFDGTCFRDTKWDYSRIEMLAHDEVDQALYDDLRLYFCRQSHDNEKVLNALEGMMK